eukprot:11908557-Karenia_brevis.AAC.1
MLHNKRIIENACGDFCKRVKANNSTVDSKQRPGSNRKRNILVRTMSGQVVYHGSFEASMRIAELYRTVMRQYPGKAVSLIFENNPVELQ